MNIIDYIIIGIYMVGMLAIGYYAKGKIETMDDFILGGRRFNRIALVGTIMATMIGSGMTIGAVGNAYKFGAGGTVAWMYAGFSIGLLFFGYIAKRIRDTGKRTMAEVIALKFGNTPRLIASIIIIGYAISIVAINTAGLGNVIHYIFGETLPISLSMATAISALICIVYTSMGGFYAVVWTDVIQLVITIIGIFLLGPILGLNYAGGFSNVANTYTQVGSSITNPFINGVSAGSIGFFLAYFLTVPGDPTMPQRALAAKDDKSATVAFYISGFMGMYIGVSILLLGGSIFTLMPGLENAEAALPLFILKYYPPAIKGITIAGIVAAIMSSFDSFLILATTHLIYDVGQSLNKDLDEKTISKILPFATLAIGVLGLIIALFISSLFDYLYMVFSIIGSALAPVLLSALFCPEKTTNAGVISSMVVGTLVPAVLYLTVGYDVFLGDPVFLGLIASTASLIIVSMVTKKNKDATEKVDL